jgi:hypothetical protein
MLPRKKHRLTSARSSPESATLRSLEENTPTDVLSPDVRDLLHPARGGDLWIFLRLPTQLAMSAS